MNLSSTSLKTDSYFQLYLQKSELSDRGWKDARYEKEIVKKLDMLLRILTKSVKICCLIYADSFQETFKGLSKFMANQ